MWKQGSDSSFRSYNDTQCELVVTVLPTAWGLKVVGCATGTEASGNLQPGRCPPRCHVQACPVLDQPSLPPWYARTAEPRARALHPSKPKMASPLGTTLASSRSGCLMHSNGFLRTTQRAHRLVCFGFPLALDLPFMFSIKHGEGAQCISTEVKQRFSTSGIRFHKNVVASRTESPQEHLHAKSQVAALTSLRGVHWGGECVWLVGVGERLPCESRLCSMSELNFSLELSVYRTTKPYTMS